MLDFKPIELKDRELFHEYLKDYDFLTYEYSFLTLYIWRKMYNTEFAIVDDTIVIKKRTANNGTYFMQPIGADKSKIADITLKLNTLRKNNPDFKYLYGDVETPFLEQLHENFGNLVTSHEDKNNFDYIFNSKDLIKLSGKKYHRKKNQYNQFIKKYDYRIEEIQSPEVIKNCIDLSLKWYDYKSLQSEQLKNEQKAIFDIFSNIKIFNNIKGIAVYVNNEIAGFAIGEKLNSKMATVHFEKGNYNFSGIYPFLNKSLVEIFFRDVEFINLQEDLGLEGLRRAKSAYQPIKLEKKYLVNI
ncbi:MAG TPA: DUF2156 domain-containing protein [Hungateiclostridium thermocellum]|uniref:Phosphatidylglycerol lysyltransferase C-terminal domain-containing protein n=1 Tax=Acetivibrio thermocellus (strain ATCC 27405 / DSM 1237 / JCM 9322 / NBRC 103400 / NCIMB 10682 / NRRL B-4536 / VPI 7372) TaxID=203119 RepID=A3DC02_ACET2|nr:DUF2156 domain-containing protein [Acetivibrio thermocellus]ABN51481.1 hypothetical protein Cthe_0242 [Acetivibrio thermocellus ATCC 27405]UWV45988.1 DUF2156 domain-containing protein [Acetivibrio thermocellus]HBW26549.1 DUF2156 domain-containing protein [Acetivibrio thermocellus]